jgi:hypothetical protein
MLFIQTFMCNSHSHCVLKRLLPFPLVSNEFRRLGLKGLGLVDGSVFHSEYAVNPCLGYAILQKEEGGKPDCTYSLRDKDPGVRRAASMLLVKSTDLLNLYKSTGHTPLDDSDPIARANQIWAFVERDRE